MAGRIDIELDMGDGEWPAPVPDQPRRGRWRVAAVLAALVVVLVVVAIAVTPRTAPSRTSSVTTAGVSPAPSLASSTTASVDGRPGSTATPGPASSTVTGLGGRSWPTETHMVLMARTGTDLAEIDLDAGVVHRTAVPSIDSTGPVFLVAGGTWILERPLDNVLGYLLRDGGPPQRLSGSLAAGTFGVFPTVHPDRVWIVKSGDTDALVVVNVDDGTEAGPPIPLNGLMEMTGDGNGQVLAFGAGGVYVTSGRGLRRVATGSLLAVNATTLVINDCDDTHQCTVTVIDRRTGAHQQLPLTPQERLSPGIVSPDGRYGTYLSGHQLRMIDLTTGADTTIGYTGDYYPSQVWSSDGRYLFFVSDSGLITVHDTTTTTATTPLDPALRAEDLTARHPPKRVAAPPAGAARF